MSGAIAPRPATPAIASMDPFAFPEPGLELNSGGPSSRRRSQPLVSSVLGPGRGHVRLPRERDLGFRFDEDTDPLEVVDVLLDELGYGDPAEADAALLPPLPPCICALVDRAAKDLIATPMIVLRPTPFTCGLAKGSRVRGVWDDGQPPIPVEQILVDALILGHCTATHFNPARPILWTRTSLKRHLRLYRSEGFYV